MAHVTSRPRSRPVRTPACNIIPTSHSLWSRLSTQRMGLHSSLSISQVSSILQLINIAAQKLKYHSKFKIHCICPPSYFLQRLPEIVEKIARCWLWFSILGLGPRINKSFLVMPMLMKRRRLLSRQRVVSCPSHTALLVFYPRVQPAE